MSDVLPPQAGLTVGGIVYRYSVSKEVQDAYKVYIENLDKQNPGSLVFQSIDDWSGLPGNTIKKNIAIPDVLIDRFGDGQIRTEGDGSVDNANVQYYYKYDKCFNPISDPTCPGWADALYKYLLDNDLLKEGVVFEDPYWNEFVQALLNAKVDRDKIEEEAEEIEDEEEEEEKQTLQRVLAINEKVISLVKGLDQDAILLVMDRPEVQELYSKRTIAGGEYLETIELKDGKINDNARAGVRLGLASSVKHEEMVSSQYKRKTNE